MTGHVFLSYRSIESDFALKLAADLKNAGVRLWMDRLDGIRGGDEWRRSIEDALTTETCAALIASLSPEYVEAEYCRKELSRANRLKIPIFPVLLRPVPDNKIPLEVEGVQWLDLREWQDETKYREKLAELLKLLPDAQKGSVPDVETRYLTSLIADLESRKGVLEYVELSAQTESVHLAETIRPKPKDDEEWAAGFSMLRSDTITSASAQAILASAGVSDQNKIYFKTIFDAVEKCPRFVLIGNPGAGKTTTIRRLALHDARKRLEDPHTCPLPILLYLPRWGNEPTTIDFLLKNWPLDFDPAILPTSPEVHLYLDGLNEMGTVGSENAAKLRDWLNDINRVPRRIIFTCRSADYGGDLRLGDLPTVTADEMDSKQIQQFAVNYLGSKADDFLKRILPTYEVKSSFSITEDERSLFRLAKNPYLLAALLFVYENTPKGSLPRNNGALFRALSRALWERERIKRTSGWVIFEEMEDAFAGLAFAMIDKGMSTDIPLEFALDYLKADSLLRVAERANLIEVRGHEIRFYHQLIQEYFAAVQATKTGYIRLLNPTNSQLLGDRLSSTWDEVIIAMCGISPDPDEIIATILLRDLVLARLCMSSGVAVSSEIREKIDTEYERILVKLERQGETVDPRARWGTARFKENSILVIRENYTDKLISLRPQENKKIMVGCSDGSELEQPELDLTPFGAMEKGVSRIHLSIELYDQTIIIEDMGSRFGTRLNGTVMSRSTPRVLRDGDAVRLGFLLLSFYFY